MSSDGAEINFSLTEHFQFKDIYEAWQLAFVQTYGKITKAGLSEMIGIVATSWSEKMDNPGNPFYEEQRKVIRLMRGMGNYLPLHAIASACGFVLVEKSIAQPANQPVVEIDPGLTGGGRRNISPRA